MYSSNGGSLKDAKNIGSHDAQDDCFRGSDGYEKPLQLEIGMTESEVNANEVLLGRFQRRLYPGGVSG